MKAAEIIAGEHTIVDFLMDVNNIKYFKVKPISEDDIVKKISVNDYLLLNRKRMSEELKKTEKNTRKKITYLNIMLKKTRALKRSFPILKEEINGAIKEINRWIEYYKLHLLIERN
jgi:hypothetical protein